MKLQQEHKKILNMFTIAKGTVLEWENNKIILMIENIQMRMILTNIMSMMKTRR